ncbi:MAG: acyl-CoA dehydrogenase family protein [Candidatus Hydrogenedentes bacterium]|nr:acyl-CoA dehydrogenase family protein [Candidatus Hydrogenedentota bacterium]
MDLTENQAKQKAMDLAEDSRQSEWRYPSFVAELFQGNFRWDLIHPYPVQTAEDKQVGDDFIEKTRVVLERFIDPEEVDRTGEVPREALLALAELGCFGIKIPVEYGGLGMSQTNYNRICSFISSYCASTAVWISAHQSIGVPQPLKIFGTKEQKEAYLPRLARGAISAFALTEPGVGSDPAQMTTTATPSDDGSYYLLNGEKLWCTNGPAAEILVVMAVTPPKIVRGKERKQITAFIVESDMPGFEVAQVCSFMGIRGIRNGMLRFNNVKVPRENVIGKEGEGLKIALTTLNTGRLTVPSTSSALGKGVMHMSRDWCRERVQWGLPIGEHQAVGSMLATIAADTFAMESMAWLACAMVDRGGADIRLEAALAKYYCTETSCRIADDFVQIRGGRGYETSVSLAARGEAPIPAERIYRDCRISRIIEGTSEIMRLFIAREAMDSHMRRIMPLLDPRKPLAAKKPLIWQAIKFYVPWYCRQWIPSSAGYDTRHLSGTNSEHLTYIAGASQRLARTMFHTMAKYKQKLECEQLILQRFVDIGTDLFAMAAVLSSAEATLASRGADNDLQDLVHLRYQWMITDIYRELPEIPREDTPETLERIVIGKPESDASEDASVETKAGV